ncbi:MAG: EFR1 family ferrodoxin, partial [Candidatus Cloacimonetes bacterium]|nr:EFR1 family ferrodoxin [Candidatus Cloacimonadota bacterium]
TAYVAKLIADQLSQVDIACKAFPMEEATIPEQAIQVESDTLIGIGFPVHAMNAPKIVYDFIKLLPSQRCSYFIFKTAGDPMFNGGSNLPIREKLGIKGWRCIHQSLFVMPANMASNTIPEKIKQLALLAEKQASILANEILNGTIVREPKSRLNPLFSLFSRLEYYGAKKNSSKWIVKESCTRCGKCVAECPTKNITDNGTNLIFGDKCIWCLRCSFNCPAQALMMINKVMDKLRVEPYDIAKIVADTSITADYFGANLPRRYLRFKRYFQKQGLITS